MTSPIQPPRSPHAAGRLGLILVTLVLLPLWLAIGAMGAAQHSSFYVASVIFWLVVMVALASRPRCPTCRQSVFTGRWGPLRIGRPWPSRTCSRCGKDLTMQS